MSVTTRDLELTDALLDFANRKLAKAETAPSRVDRDELQRRFLQAFIDVLRDYFEGFAERAGIPFDVDMLDIPARETLPRIVNPERDQRHFKVTKRATFVGFPRRAPFDLRIDWDAEANILADAITPEYTDWLNRGAKRSITDIALVNAEVNAVQGLTGALSLGDYDPSIRAQLSNRIVRITDVQRTVSRTIVQRGIEQGLSTKQIANGVKGFPGIRGMIEQSYKNRARTIALTESANAYNLGQLEGYRRSGVVDKVRIFDGLDCGFTSHDDPDKANGTTRTLAQAQAHPTSHPNAVLEGSTFVSYGPVIEMVRAWYDGPSVMISVGSDRLTIGPNHPMLTRRGWVVASELSEGDQLVHDARGRRGQAPDTDLHEIPLVEDAFEAFFETCPVAAAPTASHDLHGDAVFCQGEVEIVWPAGELLGVDDAPSVEQSSKADLVGSDMQLSGKVSGSTLQPSFERVRSSTSSLMGGADPSLPMLGRYLGGRDTEGAGQVATLGEFPPHGGRLDAETGGEFGRRQARVIEALQFARGWHLSDASTSKRTEARSSDTPYLDFVTDSASLTLHLDGHPFAFVRIDSVRVGHFTGWAFDGTTSSGAYLTDGYLTRNCQRAWAPVPVGPTQGTGATRSPVTGKPRAPSNIQTSTPTAPSTAQPAKAVGRPGTRLADGSFTEAEQFILPDGHVWDDVAGVIRGPDGFAKAVKVDKQMQKRITEVLQDRYGIGDVKYSSQQAKLFDPEDMRSMLRGFEDFRELGVGFDDLEMAFNARLSGTTWAHADAVVGRAGGIEMYAKLAKETRLIRAGGKDADFVSNWHGTPTSFRSTIRHELGHALDDRIMSVHGREAFARSTADLELLETWRVIHRTPGGPINVANARSQVASLRTSLKHVDDTIEQLKGHLNAPGADKTRQAIAQNERLRRGYVHRIDSIEDSLRTGKPREGIPTKYGRKTAAEDFGESVDLYLDDAAKFKRTHPVRAAHVEEVLERARALPKNYADDVPVPRGIVAQQERAAAKKAAEAAKRKATADAKRSVADRAKDAREKAILELEARNAAIRAEAKRVAERQAAQRKALEETAARRRAVEEAAKRKAAEDARRRAAEEAARRKAIEEAEASSQPFRVVDPDATMDVATATRRLNDAGVKRVQGLGDMDAVLRNELVQAVEDMARIQPDGVPTFIVNASASEIRKAGVKGLRGRPAAVHRSNLLLNRSFFSSKAKLADYDAALLRSGDHSVYQSVSSKMSGLQYTIAHEWGHLVDHSRFGFLAGSRHMAAASKYARTDFAERWAEGFTQFVAGLDTEAAGFVSHKLAR